MTPNELRIGNWISMASWNADPEVKQVTAFDIANIVKFKYAIEPIPLTEEWLVKFGFEDNLPWEYKQFRLDDQDRFHVVDQTGYGIIIARGIKYVHQLQNLYFALTGEELPIKEV